MAAHRRRRPPLLKRAFTSPNVLTSWTVALEFVVMAIVMPSLFYMLTHNLLIVAGTAIAGLVGAFLDVRSAVLRIQERKALQEYHAEVHQYHDQVKADATLVVPSRAAWTSHCGCTHVHEYVDGQWLRMEVSELNPDCPLVAGYGTLGGHGV